MKKFTAFDKIKRHYLEVAMDGFLFWFFFAVVILCVTIAAIVTGNVAYFVNQMSLGKDANEEE